MKYYVHAIWFCKHHPYKHHIIKSPENYKPLLMPCPFTGSKMFCAGPNFLSQHKNLTAFSASSKTFVLAQKIILLNANHLFVWHKMFVTGAICKQIFGLVQKIWTGTKHFGTCKWTRHNYLYRTFLIQCVITQRELSSFSSH